MPEKFSHVEVGVGARIDLVNFANDLVKSLWKRDHSSLTRWGSLESRPETEIGSTKVSLDPKQCSRASDAPNRAAHGAFAAKKFTVGFCDVHVYSPGDFST